MNYGNSSITYPLTPGSGGGGGDAEQYAQQAAQSASQAASSASAASSSAQQAATSQTQAASSASAASTSASQAATSESNADSSATAASTSAQQAATSESNAESYASAASTSAQQASASATAASGSAESASQSATSASQSATAASSSASQAATSQTQASDSASAASTSASAASTSAQQAATSQTQAASSATAASQSASQAASSATAASQSASQAASSASAASTSASQAATSESNADSSATAASTSAQQAAQSASQAASTAASITNDFKIFGQTKSNNGVLNCLVEGDYSSSKGSIGGTLASELTFPISLAWRGGINFNTTNITYAISLGGSGANSDIRMTVSQFGDNITRIYMGTTALISSIQNSAIQEVLSDDINNFVLIITSADGSTYSAKFYINGSLFSQSTSAITPESFTNSAYFGFNRTIAGAVGTSNAFYADIAVFNFDMSDSSSPYTVDDYAAGNSIPAVVLNTSATQRALLALDNFVFTNGSTKIIPDYSGGLRDATVSGTVMGDKDTQISRLTSLIVSQVPTA